MKLEDQLGCFGYFGFGAGFDWAKGGLTAVPGDGPAPANYCLHTCRRAAKCWLAHRRRVQLFVPEAARQSDQVARTRPGPRFLEVLARAQGRALTEAIEPYSAVMTANAVDGMAVATDQPLRYRGPMTLPWDPKTKRLTPIADGPSRH